MQPEKNKKKNSNKHHDTVPPVNDKDANPPVGFSKGAVNESTTDDRKNVNGDPNIIQGNRLDEENAQP